MKIGETAPDFEAETTQGRIRFHDWIGDSWAVLFSHPKDFTPVCTTELGYMARIKPEFDRRNVKIIGLSVDSTGDHQGWAKDIEETQGHAPNYPIIGDADFAVSKLYGMLGADVSGDPADRKFSVFCFRGGRLIGVESVNRTADHVVARRVLAGDPGLSPEQAADEGHDLRAHARRLSGR